MSRPFTSSLAKSLYSSPRQTPNTTSSTPEHGKSSPSTPVARYPSPLPKTPLTLEQTPTGKWSHPAVEKVSVLQSRRAPNDTTLRRIFYNIGALFVLYKMLPFVYPLIQGQGMKVTKYVDWTVYALYALLAYNIAENMRRFWWKNNYDDPNLTARQRNLLNLPTSPVVAQSGKSPVAITPPKYPKTFTPSPSSQSPLAGRRNSYSSYSPSNSASTQLGRSSPLQLAATTNRSVSMLSNAAPQSISALSNSLLSSQGPSSSPSSEFKGSSRWKYTQTVGKAQT